MPDRKTIVTTIITFIVGAVFNALARTYSRQALYFALVASSSLCLLYLWRDWFGNSSWRIGLTLCIGVFAASVASAAWWFTHPESESAQPTQADTSSKSAPRLVLDDFGVANASMLVNGPTREQPVAAAEVSQAFVVIRNDPEAIDETSVAKNVRAQAVVFDTADPNKPLFTMELQWPAPERDPKVVTNFNVGGDNVWFDAGQRRRLYFATKFVVTELAYGLRTINEPYDWAVPGYRVPEGSRRVRIELRSTTSSIKEDFTFVLRHSGAGSRLFLEALRP